MGVIADIDDRVAVMYADRLIEIGPVEEIIRTPKHPYTTGLMQAIPSIHQLDERLNQIPGNMPRLNAIPAGRSEEHTSELQSRGHLVCRLLLEKKKKKQIIVNSDFISCAFLIFKFHS